MPPHSFYEWMLGQNISQNISKHPKKSNKLRHVVSFDVLTDDESGSDIYRIAVPRGKPTRPKRTRVASEPAKSSLKQPSPAILDSETESTTDVSEETSLDEDTSSEEPDPTCPCKRCIEGRRKLKQMRQVRIKEKTKKSIPVASSSEDKSEEDIAAAIHAQHQAKKQKKVSFADMSPGESNSDTSIVKVKPKPKKEKKKSDVAVSVSSTDETGSEDSSVEAKVEVKKSKKGAASVAVALSSGDESESEASVVQSKPKANQGKKMTSILKKTKVVLTPDSSGAGTESDATTASLKKRKKANASKPKDSTVPKINTKIKKKIVEPESGESSAEGTPSETEEETEETEEDTEEEAKAQSSKGKQKSKGADKKAKTSSRRDNEQKATSKKGGKMDGQKKKKSAKKHEKPVSESESESEFESEFESEVEVPKKVKSKPKEEKEKGPKKVTGYPPARSPPHIRQPNMLLPPRTSVMRVEHAVEDPVDPRPNAFFDNDSGTTRVYHGPAYGNSYAMLYPKRTYNYQNLPVGVPHPVQNPWYNGFPQSQTGAADETNPWFRGWGTVGPAPIPPNMPPPPNSAPTKDKNNQKHHSERYNQSPPRSRGSRDRDAGWDSNVIPIPSIEVAGANGSNHSQGSKAGSASGRPWGAQGVPGPSWSPDKKTGKRRNKDNSAKDVTSTDTAFNDTLAGLGKALQEAAEKDSADLRARDERWSNRSGSNKESSPLPTNGWGDTNNNNGGGWGVNSNSGGGRGWDAAIKNTGGNSVWDNPAANDSQGNSGGNSGWDKTTTSNNNGGWGNNGTNGEPSNTNNDGGWNDNNNNGGWGTNNNSDNGNNDWANYQPNNDTNDGNTWQPVRSPPSPFPQNSTPIPGTWASPVLSSQSNRSTPNWGGGNVGGHTSPLENRSKGKGKAVESGPGWGDDTLAQSSGGYWNTKEGQADIAKGATGNSKKGKNESWW
ncbi:hypothetical protein GQX73_g9025 [Xylaria multiplex]|uniref:Uncharacterized protein n=1 Tax=Xylaria multiplex TaxID=323545 RepID=A0A7C8IM73_9PEZI|nr:hypothetical protein GQX73_g9025 [Xylaria multiplex]